MTSQPAEASPASRLGGPTTGRGESQDGSNPVRLPYTWDTVRNCTRCGRAYPSNELTRIVGGERCCAGCVEELREAWSA